MMPLVTVILSAWNRLQYLEAQIESLRCQSLNPLNIWLWADRHPLNNHKTYDYLDIDKLFLTNCGSGVYGRFSAALLVSTEYVAILDDDMIPGRRYLENCLTTCVATDAIVAAAGVQFLSSEQYLPCDRFGWTARTAKVMPVDVGCNGWFLRKEWVKYLWMEPPYDWTNGEDMQLSFLAQKYGGISTVTPAQATEEFCATTSILGRDEVALSSKTTHYMARSEQLKDQLKRGWKTVKRVELL
jgi:hypothetical protein